MIEISVEIVIRTDYETIRIEEISPSCESDVPGVLGVLGVVADVAVRKAKAAVNA